MLVIVHFILRCLVFLSIMLVSIQYFLVTFSIPHRSSCASPVATTQTISSVYSISSPSSAEHYACTVNLAKYTK